MTSPAASADAFDPDAERAARHARMLQEMAEIGMELMRDLRDQALAPIEAEAEADAPSPSPLSRAEAAIAFQRLSRAVRLTMMLETRFAEARTARRDEDPAARAARERAEWRAKFAARYAALPWAERRRDVLRGVVPEMIGTAIEREPCRENLNLYERCETVISEALEDREILDRPIPELMARICRDLGIEPDWRQWEPERWAGTGHELAADDLAPKPADDAAPPTARPPDPTPAPKSAPSSTDAAAPPPPERAPAPA